MQIPPISSPPHLPPPNTLQTPPSTAVEKKTQHPLTLIFHYLAWKGVELLLLLPERFRPGFESDVMRFLFLSPRGCLSVRSRARRRRYGAETAPRVQSGQGSKGPSQLLSKRKMSNEKKKITLAVLRKPPLRSECQVRFPLSAAK